MASVQSPSVPHLPITKSRFGLSPFAGAPAGLGATLLALVVVDVVDELDEADEGAPSAGLV